MAVVDASVIIVLGKSNALWLLRRLFGKVLITSFVYGEMMTKADNEESKALEEAVKEGWVVVKEASLGGDVLEKGESSSIWLAEKEKRILIVDDRKAAFIASTYEVKCHGTLYLVFLGMKKNIIKNKKEAVALVSQLVSNGLYLGSDVLAEFYVLIEEM